MRTEQRKYYRTRQWLRIRRVQLRKQAFCEACLAGHGQHTGKKLVLANTVDHQDCLWIYSKTPWTDFLKGPFSSYCKPCHDEKSKSHDMAKKRRHELLKTQIGVV